jgi:DNA end-binding protein Ku
MQALRASLGQEQGSRTAKKPKKATGQNEMLLPIAGKKKEAASKKSAAKPQRKSA